MANPTQYPPKLQEQLDEITRRHEKLKKRILEQRQRLINDGAWDELSEEDFADRLRLHSEDHAEVISHLVEDYEDQENAR